ncbi:hypothetical protein KAX02_03030 [candidate division WOR-3 bacterium]|nr:hypothetical protein [candidate division WOR-3 bacterium]
MIIKKVSIQQIALDYLDLYTEIFEEIDPAQIPAFVYLGFENDKYVGFLSGYNHNLTTIYLQYAGFIKNFRGYKAPKLFKKVIDFIHQEYDFIMIVIKNDNIPAIKMALWGGFKIVGIRMATNKDLYVEFLRGKDNG